MLRMTAVVLVPAELDYRPDAGREGGCLFRTASEQATWALVTAG